MRRLKPVNTGTCMVLLQVTSPAPGGFAFKCRAGPLDNNVYDSHWETQRPQHLVPSDTRTVRHFSSPVNTRYPMILGLLSQFTLSPHKYSLSNVSKVSCLAQGCNNYTNVTWLGIKAETFWFPDWCPNHFSAHPHTLWPPVSITVVSSVLLQSISAKHGIIWLM